MKGTALEGLRVIECASFVAGPFCAKLLADMGAEVVKVEDPHSGDEARTRGPFPGDIPHPERSGLFLYVNTNKMGVTLNLRDPAGYHMLQELLRDADCFIQDRSPKDARDLGTDYDTVKELNPRLIVTSVTPYGSTGPYADHKAYGLNVCHAGSEGYILPGGLAHSMAPDKPPVKLGGHTTDYDAGLTAAAATMFAVMAREIWGVGQPVDGSGQEAGMALNRVSFVTYFSEQIVTRRENRSYKFGGLYQARDGEVILRPTENNHWRALAKVMGQPELADDPRFSERNARAANGKEFNAIVTRWTVGHTKREIYDACKPAGCPVGACASAEEIVNEPQIRHRGFFQEIDHPEAGRWPYPTASYQFSETPWSARRPAPLLGEHNREVFEGVLGLSSVELGILRANKVI